MSGSTLFLPFIPAIAFTVPSGLRNNTSGDLWGVGTNGYAWSSSPYAAGNANGGFLNFYSGHLYPLTNTYRAHAFPVRCVQHLQEPLFTFFTDCEESESNLAKRIRTENNLKENL